MDTFVADFMVEETEIQRNGPINSKMTNWLIPTLVCSKPHAFPGPCIDSGL